MCMCFLFVVIVLETGIPSCLVARCLLGLRAYCMLMFMCIMYDMM